MLSNESELLNMVYLYFGCGNLVFNKDGSVDFLVRDLDSINNIIIPHFIELCSMRYKIFRFSKFL